MDSRASSISNLRVPCNKWADTHNNRCGYRVETWAFEYPCRICKCMCFTSRQRLNKYQNTRAEPWQTGSVRFITHTAIQYGTQRIDRDDRISNHRASGGGRHWVCPGTIEHFGDGRLLFEHGHDSVTSRSIHLMRTSAANTKLDDYHRVHSWWERRSHTRERTSHMHTLTIQTWSSSLVVNKEKLSDAAVVTIEERSLPHSLLIFPCRGVARVAFFF